MGILGRRSCNQVVSTRPGSLGWSSYLPKSGSKQVALGTQEPHSLFPWFSDKQWERFFSSPVQRSARLSGCKVHKEPGVEVWRSEWCLLEIIFNLSFWDSHTKPYCFSYFIFVYAGFFYWEEMKCILNSHTWTPIVFLSCPTGHGFKESALPENIINFQLHGSVVCRKKV